MQWGFAIIVGAQFISQVLAHQDSSTTDFIPAACPRLMEIAPAAAGSCISSDQCSCRADWSRSLQATVSLHCTLQLISASEQQEKHDLSSITSTLNTKHCKS